MSFPFLNMTGVKYDAMDDNALAQDAQSKQAIKDAENTIHERRQEFAKAIDDAREKQNADCTPEEQSRNGPACTDPGDFSDFPETEDEKQRLSEAIENLPKVMERHAFHEGPQGQGAWGVSHKMGWHSGVHFISGYGAPVRAIADGILIYKRDNEDPGDGENDPLKYRGVTTNCGCVVLRHTTDIGEGPNATSITFFSIYMHLNSLVLKKADAMTPYTIGERIPRKTPLGYGGKVYGRTYETHFELVCDNENLAKLTGRAPGVKLDLSKNGRTDAVYGDTYFHIKAGVKIYDVEKDYKKEHEVPIQPTGTVASIAATLGTTQADLQKWNPAKIVHNTQTGQYNFSTPRPGNGATQKIKLTVWHKPQIITATDSALVIRMRYQNGNAYMETRHESPKGSGNWVKIAERSVVETANYEYELSIKAKNLTSAYTTKDPRTGNYPSIGAFYALLRFGREAIWEGAANYDPLPAGAKHIREIVYNSTGDRGFIDLADKSLVKVYSDADFPEFAGWSFVQDDYLDKDCRCESPTILKWLDESGDAPVQGETAIKRLEEREERINHAHFQEKIGQAFLRIPCDWDNESIETRWGWLKNKKEAEDVGLEIPMSAESFERFSKHVEKLGFWTEAKAGNEKANANIAIMHEAPYKEALTDYEKDAAAQARYDAEKAKHDKATADYAAYQSAMAAYNTAMAASPRVPPTEPLKVEKPGKAPKEPKLKGVAKPEPPPPLGPLPGFINPQDCWHLPPRMFIEHMKRCLWLDREDLARIYPDDCPFYKAFLKNGHFKDKNALDANRERYRVLLNRITEKYLINTPLRLSHFYGQGYTESYALGTMKETTVGLLLPGANLNHPSVLPEKPGPNGYYTFTGKDDKYFGKVVKYENRLGNVDTGDGVKFRGRGMKQLTGRENYARYWAYRGWLKEGIDFQYGWFVDNTKKKAMIDEPQIICLTDYCCIDTAGYYWTAGATSNKLVSKYTSINKIVDSAGSIGDSAVTEVTRAINGGINGIETRKSATKDAAKVLLDQ